MTTVFSRNKQAANLGSRRIKGLFSPNALVTVLAIHVLPWQDKQVYRTKRSLTKKLWPSYRLTTAVLNLSWHNC